MTPSAEEAIRQSHCAREGHEHECVGECTITRDGIKLRCALCGQDNEMRYVSLYDSYLLPAKAILRAAGLNWTALSTDAQISVVATVRKYLEKAKL